MPFCSKCGFQLTNEALFCPNCGQKLDSTSSTTSTYLHEIPRKRPSGITILAVLEILVSIIFLGLGIILLVLAGIIGITGVFREVPITLMFFGGVFVAIGGLILVSIGGLGFAISYGYWNGSGWAWTLGMLVSIFGLILGLLLFPEGIIGLAIDIIIIYYLTRPHVKRYFGK